MPTILFFPYFGPNRRAELRVVEIMLGFNPDEPDVMPAIPEIRQLLLDVGIQTDPENYPDIDSCEDDFSRYSHLLAQTALLLQRENGHRVNFYSASVEPDLSRYIVLVEHEDSEVAMSAVKLAATLTSGKADSFAQDYRAFSGLARDHALSLETEAIIRRAGLRNIPCFQLEREPLKGVFNSIFRVRPNGWLMLGHAQYRHVLDGTFCVDRAGDELKALLRNPGQRLALINNLLTANTPTEGVQLAGAKTETRAETGAKTEPGITQFQLLVVNHLIVGLERLGEDSTKVVDQVDDSILEMCRALYTRVGCAAMSISLNATSLSLPLSQSCAQILDFDPAPDLGVLLGHCPNAAEFMDSAVDQLLDWLFPEPDAIRIPVIAVTGTNGKTTTSRMINHILKTAGRKPGLVCSDGIFLNTQQITDTDASSIIGHVKVLTSPKVDSAVLETHHRGIAVRGFAFNACDVAVCLNVTEEHLEKDEIETLEQMVVVKRALLERASETAILFADDPCCLSMIEHLKAKKICLVSLRSGHTQLAQHLSADRARFCVLEKIAGEDWIVLYDGQLRVPVMPVSQIPATFDGTARFNVSNAMHAIAACYFSAADVDAIEEALSNFHAGERFTPGRLNEIKGLPFRIFIDFAHNPDGMKNICDFADRTQVHGRKVVAFAAALNRSEESNTKVAKAVAGHFDFYFCKDYQPKEGSLRKFLAPFIQQVLIDEGVAEEQTAVVRYGQEDIYRVLDACKPDDLLILLLGHVEKKTVPPLIKEYIELKSRAEAN